MNRGRATLVVIAALVVGGATSAAASVPAAVFPVVVDVPDRATSPNPVPTGTPTPTLTAAPGPAAAPVGSETGGADSGGNITGDLALTGGPGVLLLAGLGAAGLVLGSVLRRVTRPTR